MMSRKSGFSIDEVYSRYNTCKGDLPDTEAALMKNKAYIEGVDAERESEVKWYAGIPLIDMNSGKRKRAKDSISPEREAHSTQSISY